MAKLIEKGTNYAYTIERIKDITFTKLRSVVVDFTRRLPADLNSELYEAIQHGVCQLQSEPELNMYIHALGLMHEAKLQHAFEHLPSEFTDYEAIEIIDYGCGQAIGTICYADFLRKNGYAQEVRRITLIEPSEIALKRAALHASCFFPNAEIITINKGFDDLVVDDLCIEEEIPTLHIFSNVLDLADDYFNLENFANLVKNCSQGENQYVCIEPYFEYDDKDMYPDIFFQKLGIEPYYRQIFQKGEFVEGREWTCFVIVCEKNNNKRSWHECVMTTDIEEYWSDEDMRLLIESAEQGDIHAQCELGHRYYDGRGVEQNTIEAVKWYHKAAVSGDSYAQYKLGCCYEYGVGVMQDYDKAIFWYINAVNQIDDCAYNLGRCYDKIQNYTEAVKWFRILAEKGYEGGAYELGYHHEYGLGVSQDIVKAIEWYSKSEHPFNTNAQYRLGKCFEKMNCYTVAIKWYRKAAEQGYAKAQFRLGRCYHNGLGIKQNYHAAAKWYRKSAERDNASAQHNLGYCYYFGEGVEQDLVEAVKWYKKAAEQGTALSQNALGDCYKLGEGVEQNYTTAAIWYHKAAEQGDAEAQFNLGVCYAKGQGVEHDQTEAAKWYRKAAEQGHKSAQFNLAVRYTKGQGVIKDDVEAVKWYKKAAEQGNARAQFNLGVRYTKGQGVTKDVNEAVRWYIKAAEQGHKAAQEALEKLKLR